MKKKQTKLEKRNRKGLFLRNYSASIMEQYTAKVYPHFIKIEIAGVECDYYPGAGKINRIINGRNEWSDLEPEDLLKHLNIPI